MVSLFCSIAFLIFVIVVNQLINETNMIKLPEEVLDTFGRIIYAVAKSDGQVQEEEVNFIHHVIDNHEWAQEMELSKLSFLS